MMPTARPSAGLSAYSDAAAKTGKARNRLHALKKKPNA
jgi:hypothetical protein